MTKSALLCRDTVLLSSEGPTTCLPCAQVGRSAHIAPHCL
jgi:hypothetical protein